MDRGAWRATGHGVAKNQTQVKRITMLVVWKKGAIGKIGQQEQEGLEWKKKGDNRDGCFTKELLLL